jgi:hypothetical protein
MSQSQVLVLTILDLGSNIMKLIYQSRGEKVMSREPSLTLILEINMDSDLRIQSDSGVKGE